MKPLSPNARRLIELTQGQDVPNASSRSRVARSLSGRIASGVIVGAAGTSIPAAAASLGSAGVGLGAAIAKSVLVVCVTGAVATTGYLKLRTPRPPTVQPRPAPATVSLPSAPAPTIQTPPAPALPVPDPTPRKSARLAPRPEPKVVAPRPVDHLHDEAEALRSVQQALRDGQAPQALRLLDAQDVRFRGGLLQQERAAARVLALCQTGAVARARAQAEDFQTRWPRSALIARIRFACWKP